MLAIRCLKIDIFVSIKVILTYYLRIWEGGANHSAFGNKSFHGCSRWSLSKLMEGRITIKVGSLFQNLTTCNENDVFLQSFKGMTTLTPSRTSGIKKRLVSISNSLVNTLYAAMKSPQTRRLLRERRPSRRIFLRMAGGGNPLQASSTTTVFAPNNRHRQLGLAGLPAWRTQDGASS